jgi:hypothetical protein
MEGGGDRCKDKRRVYKRDTVCSYLCTKDPPRMASRLQYGVKRTRKRDLPCGETFAANHITLIEALSGEAYAGAH